MYSPLSTITSFVSGLITFLFVYLPVIRSASDSITLPSFSLINASTTTPCIVPQSCSLTITSCTTSTKRLVK